MGIFFGRSPYDPEWVKKLLMKGPYAPAGTTRRTAPPLAPATPVPPPPRPPEVTFETRPSSPAAQQRQKVPGLRHYDKPLHLRFGDQRLEVNSLADLPEMSEEQVRMIEPNLYSDLFDGAHSSLVPAWIAIEKGMRAKAQSKLTRTQSPKPAPSGRRLSGTSRAASPYTSGNNRQTRHQGSTNLRYSSDFVRQEDIDKVERAVQSAARQISRKLSRVKVARDEFRKTKGSERTPSDQAIQMGEQLMGVTSQPTASMAFSRAVSLMRRAHRKLTSGSTRAERGTCNKRHDNACAQIGGSVIRFPDKFFRTPPPKKTSIIVHEAIHLAGADDPEAENFECFVSSEFCKVASFTKTL